MDVKNFWQTMGFVVIFAAVIFLQQLLNNNYERERTNRTSPEINVEQLQIYNGTEPKGLRSNEAVHKFENILLSSTITEKEWLAILEVETEIGTFSPGHKDGIAQITDVCVRDVNEILGEARYTVKDKCDPEKAHEIFNVYTNYYAGLTAPFSVKARIWNGGPDGNSKDATIPYWGKVKAALESNQE